METQLPLIDPTPKAWTLDRRTREIGLRGVARAREVLRRAVPPTPVEAGSEPADGAAPRAA